MHCSTDPKVPWTEHELTFRPIPPTTTTTTPAMTTTERVSSYLLHLDGACDHLNYLNDEVFEKVGMTVSGLPYYKSRTYEYYIYHDRNCNAGTDIKDARWIIDNNRPDPSKRVDLDNDGNCD